MNFIWATNDVAVASATLYETNITLNKAACEYFNEVRYVMLGFDQKNLTIAIKPISKEMLDEGIYPRSQLHRLSMGKSYGRISNKSFLKDIAKYAKIDLSHGQGIKYPAHFDVIGQLMTIQLRKEER